MGRFLCHGSLARSGRRKAARAQTLNHARAPQRTLTWEVSCEHRSSTIPLGDCQGGSAAPLIDTRPRLLAFDVDGPGRDMAQLRAAIGGRRIDEGIAKA